jgi:malate/lactate dehydrogenase
MASPKLKTTIAILGCGDVGSTLAYTLILQPICSEVILVDLKASLLEAQVRDLNDATYRGGSGVKVRAGTHKDAGQADIVVITAGAKQKTGESRLSLLSRNLHILESIFGAMAPISPHTILLLVANPVDILTYFARRLSGLPENQVLGTGTSLDSARLRGVLAEKAEVAPNSIDAYVLGEHGDSQFVSVLYPSLRRRKDSIEEDVQVMYMLMQETDRLVKCYNRHNTARACSPAKHIDFRIQKPNLVSYPRSSWCHYCGQRLYCIWHRKHCG